MNEKCKTKISKFLSLVLRHKPKEIGLTLDENGWANINNLIENAAKFDNNLTIEDLTKVVETNDKRRFSIDDTKTKIRANQGHSIEVEIGFEEKFPPPILYHGTAERNLDSILKTGLKKMNRHHVHLSSETETARNVGIRYGKPIILQVDSAQMAKSGIKFYISVNEVWLVDDVSPEFLKIL